MPAPNLGYGTRAEAPINAVNQWMRTQPWYQSLMDAVSRLMWTNGKHATLWRQQAEYLRTPDGIAYSDALIAE